MTRIDQFESAFLSAAKTVFSYERVEIDRGLVITDLSDYEARLFGDRARAFLRVLGDKVQWRDIHGDVCESVGEMLDLVEAERPDLICTYRHLHSGAWRWPYGLGEHLDVLTQVTTTPVLVFPRPDDEASFAKIKDTNVVMAMTTHLTGDHRLINYAARFTEAHGTLFATHVEEQATFERYLGAISKIPSIDTGPAREAILKQLLKEARDYIGSCREVLAETRLTLKLDEVVTLGHHLSDYKKLVEEHEADLLVLNTKDEDQLAMHGLAYPLAVELRQLPLLML
jgi:hypothetical protein